MSDSLKPPAVIVHSVTEIEKFAAWVLGMVVAVAVFFQVHVTLPGGVINLNLADPFAILTLAAVMLHTLVVRQLPAWRISQFNLALGVISLLFLLGFIHGWLEIGITQWALGGRLLGWLVLLGYLSAGYIIVANVGAHGLRRFAETLIATATVVVMLQVVLRLLEHWGVNTGARLAPNFEGYAGNRNAFAFQLLTGMALLLGYSQVYARQNIDLRRPARPWIFSLLLGILLAGLVWTGSRTGMLVGMLALLLAWGGRLADRRMLGWGVIFAALLWCVVLLAAQKALVQGVLSGDFWDLNGLALTIPVQSDTSTESSNLERWETLTHGLEMWRQSPILGVGLGVFNAKSPMWAGHPQVIHSTPLWILAEFGLLGGAVFGWAFFQLARHAIGFVSTQPAQRILLLLLIVFAIFCLAHEMFYQRIFWLVLGAVLAQPLGIRRHA
jgi:O-antigen ligase